MVIAPAAASNCCSRPTSALPHSHARFGLPEVKWSIYPFGGATVKLVQQIGYVHAMDLILTGRLIGARNGCGP